MADYLLHSFILVDLVFNTGPMPHTEVKGPLLGARGPILGWTSGSGAKHLLDLPNGAVVTPIPRRARPSGKIVTMLISCAFLVVGLADAPIRW